jgi:hypothetical protein
MRFLLLGPLEVREGDRVIPLGGAKQRALLAALRLLKLIGTVMPTLTSSTRPSTC